MDEDQLIPRIDAIQQWQTRHEVEDHTRFTEIGDTLVDIKENHLAHIQLANEKTASDLWWIKWLVIGIASGIGVLALKALGA